jgi:hypothetical protein
MSKTGNRFSFSLSTIKSRLMEPFTEHARLAHALERQRIAKEEVTKAKRELRKAQDVDRAKAAAMERLTDELILTRNIIEFHDLVQNGHVEQVILMVSAASYLIDTPEAQQVALEMAQEGMALHHSDPEAVSRYQKLIEFLRRPERYPSLPISAMTIQQVTLNVRPFMNWLALDDLTAWIRLVRGRVERAAKLDAKRCVELCVAIQLLISTRTRYDIPLDMIDFLRFFPHDMPQGRDRDYSTPPTFINEEGAFFRLPQMRWEGFLASLGDNEAGPLPTTRAVLLQHFARWCVKYASFRVQLVKGGSITDDDRDEADRAFLTLVDLYVFHQLQNDHADNDIVREVWSSEKVAYNRDSPPSVKQREACRRWLQLPPKKLHHDDEKEERRDLEDMHTEAALDMCAAILSHAAHDTFDIGVFCEFVWPVATRWFHRLQPLYTWKAPTGVIKGVVALNELLRSVIETGYMDIVRLHDTVIMYETEEEDSWTKGSSDKAPNPRVIAKARGGGGGTRRAHKTPAAPEVASPEYDRGSLTKHRTWWQHDAGACCRAIMLQTAYVVDDIFWPTVTAGYAQSCQGIYTRLAHYAKVIQGLSNSSKRFFIQDAWHFALGSCRYANIYPIEVGHFHFLHELAKIVFEDEPDVSAFDLIPTVLTPGIGQVAIAKPFVAELVGLESLHLMILKDHPGDAISQPGCSYRDSKKALSEALGVQTSVELEDFFLRLRQRMTTPHIREAAKTHLRDRLVYYTSGCVRNDNRTFIMPASIWEALAALCRSM